MDDYDFYIRAWSQLVEVTVMFFAQFLTKHKVYKASKERGNLMRHSTRFIIAHRNAKYDNEFSFPFSIFQNFFQLDDFKLRFLILKM